MVFGISAAVEPVMTIDAPLPAGVRCGTATATVFMTPMRSTSTASWKSNGSGVTHGHGQDPGVGHDRRQVAQLGQALVQGFGELLALPNVGLDHHAGPALLLDEALRLTRSSQLDMGYGFGLDVLADVDGDDVRAFARLQHRVCTTLAAACAGDERHLACHASCHNSPVVVVNPQSVRKKPPSTSI